MIVIRVYYSFFLVFCLEFVRWSRLGIRYGCFFFFFEEVGLLGWFEGSGGFCGCKGNRCERFFDFMDELDLRSLFTFVSFSCKVEEKIYNGIVIEVYCRNFEYYFFF